MLNTCFLRTIAFGLILVLNVGLCSWSSGPGGEWSRPQHALTAPEEIVRWTKLPQRRTPVTRYCLKWNAIQHPLTKSLRGGLLHVSLLFRLPGVFLDVLVLSLNETLCKEAALFIFRHLTAPERAFASNVLSVK